ncbi:hypothetical protein [uncultured Roseobacter sp.]|uniref:hypothetical protein n=1 Tax=uncultured Roseobacter sp. TaxID=114847 RepID=UPI002604351C|nr:hypothetical protein [uncultured Roseobacter sp.]
MFTLAFLKTLFGSCRKAICTTIFFVIPLTAYAQACDFASFQSRDFGELSDVEKLVRLDSMSRSEFETAKSKSGGSIGFAGFSFGGSHDQMKQRLQAIKKASQFNSDRQHMKSWNQLFLSDNGLKAYLGCLRSQQGFHVITEALNPEDFKLRFIWTPGGSAGIPTLGDYRNISARSKETLENQLGTQPLGNSTFDLEIFFERDRPNEPSQVTIRLDGRSYVQYLPPSPQITIPDGLFATLPTECKIEAIFVNSSSCGSGFKYVGPGDATAHGGYCVRFGGCPFKVQYVNTKSCAQGVYVGPGDAKAHGGSCVWLDSDTAKLSSRYRDARINCTAGETYIGPGDFRAHGGSCVKILAR